VHRRPRPRRDIVGAVVIGVVVAGAALTACGGDQPGDAERFCGEVQANTEAIVNPTLDHPEDLEATVELYRDIGAVAPLAIEPQWEALVLNLETASTVDPSDPDSLQRVYARAYATEREAVAVRDWLLDHCQIDLGPVATIVPPAPTTVPATTVPSG
jgi:hypothetical protein